MTGLAGLTFTSRTGARFMLMPRLFNSRAMTSADFPAYSMDRVAPAAMFPGKTVAGSVTRATMPPSWSVEMKSGIFMRCFMAIFCSPFERAFTCFASRGVPMLSVQLK